MDGTGQTVHHFAVHQIVQDLSFKTEIFYLTDLLTTEVAGLGRVVTIFAVGRKGREIFGLSFAREATDQDPIVIRRLSAGVWKRTEKPEEWINAWIKQHPDQIQDGRKRIAEYAVLGYC